MIKVDPGVIELSGGTKQKWLRLHRSEILAYYEANGEVPTRERYHIVKDTTWHNFLHKSKPESGKLTRADKALSRAEIAEEGLREVKKELKEAYSRFVPFLADEIKNKFFIPLLAGKIELPAELEYKPAPDPLGLADFDGKLVK